MTVDKRSKASQAQFDTAAKARALMAGTAGMRAAGNTYLPKFPAEDEQAYLSRLNQSWLFNGFRKTVRDMAGRVFSKPVTLTTAPAQLVDWAENIDNAGNDLSTFARMVFEDGLAAGISYVMVDAPVRGGTVTQADVARFNLRPYMVMLEAEYLIGWNTAVINGQPTLVQLRIMECVKVDVDEFTQDDVDQIRVMDRTDTGVMVRLFRKGKTDTGDKWLPFGDVTMTGLPEITVFPFYANRDGFFTGKPLLDDLADVNIAHWQSQSDQRTILHYARVPILHATGRTEDMPITISAGVSVNSIDPAARLEWVEHSGKAIEAGRQDLKDLEFQMETHGLQLLQPKPGGQSATGEMLDSQKETSILGMTADELQNTLENALLAMCQYAGLGDQTVEVDVNKEFGTTSMNAQDFTAMLSAVNTGGLSKETFIGELIHRKMINGEIVVQDELDRIAAEAEALMPAPVAP